MKNRKAQEVGGLTNSTARTLAIKDPERKVRPQTRDAMLQNKRKLSQ